MGGRAAIDGQLAAATAAFAALYALLSVPVLWWQQVSAAGLLASAVLALSLAALSAIDLRDYRLPDVLTLPLAGAGLLASSWVSDAPLWWHAVSAVVGFALLAGVAEAYRYVRGREGLGLGDAKLLAASGAWLGAEALPAVLLWACGSAIVGLLIAGWRAQALSSQTRIPFGPFLAFGTWVVWLYGPV
jgi:leader peptidase (prepilin peptidase)/N-methyltransferase